MSDLLVVVLVISALLVLSDLEQNLFRMATVRA